MVSQLAVHRQAKAVLAPALIPWKEQHAQVHLSSWVDDVGFDTAGQTPLHYKLPRRLLLVDLGLRVNPKKTAFIATDKATDKGPQELPHTTRTSCDIGDERPWSGSSGGQKETHPCPSTTFQQSQTTEDQVEDTEDPSFTWGYINLNCFITRSSSSRKLRLQAAYLQAQLLKSQMNYHLRGSSSGKLIYKLQTYL